MKWIFKRGDSWVVTDNASSIWADSDSRNIGFIVYGLGTILILLIINFPEKAFYIVDKILNFAGNALLWVCNLF